MNIVSLHVTFSLVSVEVAEEAFQDSNKKSWNAGHEHILFSYSCVF